MAAGARTHARAERERLAALIVVRLISRSLAAVAFTAVAGVLVAPVVYTLVSRKD